jgi:hypothetical protein
VAQKGFWRSQILLRRTILSEDTRLEIRSEVFRDK